MAAKWKRVPTKEVKKRSGEVTDLFNSYKCYDWLVGTEQRVWILEEDKKFKGKFVGHTKQYVKVQLDSGPIGKCVLVKVTEAHKWHVCGEIIDENPEPVKVPANYWEACQTRRMLRTKMTKGGAKSSILAGLALFLLGLFIIYQRLIIS